MDKLDSTFPEDSVGLVEIQYFTFAEPPNQLELDCERKLGPVTLAYETYGQLNSDKSNAILLLHALSGDAHAAGYSSKDDRKPGWWDDMVGPGKGFDTDKYFVICSNVIGGCMGSTGPQSINPETGKHWGLDFPIITVGDMVKAQKFLIDHLSIEKLLAVAGGSLGGMQALDWLTRYPECVASGLVIASTPLLSAQAIAFDTVGREAIQTDKAFNGGDYYDSGDNPGDGLGVARMLAHITYLSDDAMRKKFGRALRTSSEYLYDFEKEFSVETYLGYQGTQFVNRFDSNSYLYITKAINYFDIAANFGSLDNAMERVQAKTLVLSFASDWLYPPYQSRAVVYSLVRQDKNVTYCNIQTDLGHDAFLLEHETLREMIGGFLHNVQHPENVLQFDVEERRKEDRNAATKWARQSIYAGHRIDHDRIVDLVDQGSRVLDIGCGDGSLLAKLIQRKQVDGLGIELSQDHIAMCMKRGISVIQHDVDNGLNAHPDGIYDYVLLSMTLQVVENPTLVLKEMLRVGKKCIVSFPNFAFWKARAKTLFTGKTPTTRSLPYAWYDTPNRHVLTIKDFRQYCKEIVHANIEVEIALSGRGTRLPTKIWPNLFADEALFVISANRT